MAYGVIIYEEEHNSFLNMSDEDAGKILKNMIRVFQGNQPEKLEGFKQMYSDSLCNRVAVDKRKADADYTNGKKGGAPIGNQNARKNKKQPPVDLKTTPLYFENNPNSNNNSNSNNNNNIKTVYKPNQFTAGVLMQDYNFIELERKKVKN